MFDLKFRSLKTKLISIFIFISMLPIIIILIFSYFISSNIIKQKVKLLLDANIRQTEKLIETTMTSYRETLFQIATDTDIIKETDNLNDEKKSVRINAENQIIDKILNIAIIKKNIVGFAVFGTNGKSVIYDLQQVDAYQELWKGFGDFRKTALFRNILESKNVFLSELIFKDKVTSKNKCYIHLGLRIIDLKDVRKDIGVVILTISENFLSDISSLSNTEVNKTGNNSFSIIIKSGDGTIISHFKNEFIGRRLKLPVVNKETNDAEYLSRKEAFGKGNYILNSIEMQNYGWLIVNIVSEKYIFNELINFQIIIILIGLIAILAAISAIVIVSDKLTFSVKTVVSAISSVNKKHDLNTRIKLKTKDEISIIADNFNSMMKKINNLVKEVEGEKEKVISATKKQKEAEIKTLENQINPHFLYNTLDSINWVAIEKKEYEISKLISSLGKILRYSIMISNTVVKVEDEINWTRQYLFLQKSRFVDLFDYSIEVDEKILNYKIHKLILQPFIENTILHGFENLDRKGFIRISGELKDNKLFFAIEDNGKGINKKKQILINSVFCGREINDASIERTLGVGIYNVFSRLKMYYGSRVDMKMSSKINSGTLFIISIPLLKENK